MMWNYILGLLMLALLIGLKLLNFGVNLSNESAVVILITKYSDLGLIGLPKGYLIRHTMTRTASKLHSIIQEKRTPCAWGCLRFLCNLAIS